MAGAVAGALKAERLILLTDVEGVLDQDKKLIPRLTVREARALIANGTISGGMIPKIQTAIDAVEGGVNAAVILDGRIPHVLLLELFTEHGAGTLITAELMMRLRLGSAGCCWCCGCPPPGAGRAHAVQPHQLYPLCRHVRRSSAPRQPDPGLDPDRRPANASWRARSR